MNTLKSVLLFCCILLMLSGCSFAPKYQRPPLPTSETYPREEYATNGINIRQLGWQEFFTDPVLLQLIATALENNRDLRIALARIGEARAVYGLSWADLFPTLNASSPNLRSRVPGDILSELAPQSPTPSPSIIFSAYLATVCAISWELDFWGRLRNLKDAALENYLATQEAQFATYISLIGQVANTYLIERELNELVSIAVKTIKTRQEAYRIIKRRYEEGSSSKLDAVQADTILQQAKVDLAILQRKRELNWNAMTLLVGAPVNPDDILLSQIENCFTTEISEGLPSALLCNRPDILAAEHLLKAANANIGAARAAFFPTISLTGSYGSASSELNNLFHAGSKFWAYIPTISMPIFDWGRNASGVAFAEAQKKLAISAYEKAIQVAFREVADSLTERTWYAEQIDLQKKALAAQEERTRLTWIRYEHGSSPYLEVLDAERDRFSAEQSLVQTRRSFLSSNVNLYIALGGGYFR